MTTLKILTVIFSLVVTRQRSMKRSSKKTFKAVVFDYSGVIKLHESGNTLNLIIDALRLPSQEFKDEYFRNNHRSNIGNLPWSDVVIDVVSTFTSDATAKETARRIIRDAATGSRINTELVSWFAKLQSDGFKVAIFSNHTTGLRSELERNGIAALVNDIVVSGEIGFQKPHQEAFDALFERLDVRPEEAIFIDDMEKSLEKSAEIGYTPLLFRDNDTLKRDLEELGISV